MLDVYVCVYVLCTLKTETRMDKQFIFVFLFFSRTSSKTEKSLSLFITSLVSKNAVVVELSFIVSRKRTKQGKSE